MGSIPVGDTEFFFSLSHARDLLNIPSFPITLFIVLDVVKVRHLKTHGTLVAGHGESSRSISEIIPNTHLSMFSKSWIISCFLIIQSPDSSHQEKQDYCRQRDRHSNPYSNGNKISVLQLEFFLTCANPMK